MKRGVASNKPGERLLEEMRTKYRGRKQILPLRPIIIGGDDVTFVCDGSIGMTLAVQFVSEFEKKTQALSEWLTKLLGEPTPLSACAGVAIVKTHYPFARAYDLSEALCKSAKTYGKQLNYKGSCIDWHFATTGLSGDLRTIREREYTGRDGSLTLRPVTVAANEEPRIRSWEIIAGFHRDFEGPDWEGKRGKVKALRDALRQGPDSVKRFKTVYGHALPTTPSDPTAHETGWIKYKRDENDPDECYCAYFDAIELLDWYAEI